MFVAVWEFYVKPNHIVEFERHYGGNGTWAELFRENPAHKETTLLRDPKMTGRYLTTDVWLDESSYKAFHERSRDRYRELDAQFTAFTEKETLIGHFEVAE